MLSGAPERITLVAMGDSGRSRSDEDEICTIHLRNRLQGRPSDPEAARALIGAGGGVLRFPDPARPHLHAEDIEIALDLDRYDFAIEASIENGRPVARPAQRASPSYQRRDV
jgi:2-phosphosulfolactate phosphatase